MSRIADAVARSVHPDDAAPPPPNVATEIAPPFDVTPPQAWAFESDADDRPAPRASGVVDTGDDNVAAEPQANLTELVQQVFRPGGEPLARTVAIAAIGHGAPPNTLLLGLARTLAAYDAGTVCIVDASGGEARLDRTTGTSPSAGLSDLLAARRPAAAVAVPVGPGVWLVPAGTGNATPASRPDAVSRVVHELADAFDFVIIAAPLGADARDLGPLLAVAAAADGLVVSLHMDAARRDVAAHIISRVRAAGVTLLGAIVVEGGHRGSSSTRGVRG